MFSLIRGFFCLLFLAPLCSPSLLPLPAVTPGIASAFSALPFCLTFLSIRATWGWLYLVVPVFLYWEVVYQEGRWKKTWRCSSCCWQVESTQSAEYSHWFIYEYFLYRRVEESVQEHQTNFCLVTHWKTGINHVVRWLTLDLHQCQWEHNLVH